MGYKSAFGIKKSKDDERFPWVVAHQGIGVTKHQTKTEALEKLTTARKKEKLWLKKNFK